MRWLVALAVVAGCSKDDTAAVGGAAASAIEGSESGPRQDLADAWKKAGLTPSAFQPAKASFGTDCKSSTVGAIEVLVCVYPSAKEAKAAEDAALTWVGDTTGAAQAHGSLVIAVADRKKSDPNGKTINQLLKLAPK
jgi:hypothetical protein